VIKSGFSKLSQRQSDDDPWYGIIPTPQKKFKAVLLAVRRGQSFGTSEELFLEDVTPNEQRIN
jgi:hypothetical protein